MNNNFSGKMIIIKMLLWRRNCSSENRAQKHCARRLNGFCWTSGNSFKKKFLQNNYFNPKCSFGHRKCKTDETERNSHWESETIYLEVGEWLMPYTIFFETIFPSVCSAGTKSAVLTTLPNSYRQKSEKNSLRPEKVWKIKKENLTPNVFPGVDCLARRLQF